MLYKCEVCYRNILKNLNHEFSCFNCNKKKIYLCLICRKKNLKYSCDCGFIGP